MIEKSEIVLFTDNDIKLKVPITSDQETVWLTQEQISVLFETARSSIAYHIGNIFKEGELHKSTSVKIFDRSENKAYRPPMYYNLDVIISVGYRVKSKRGVAFRRWANSVLKEYIIKGYAVNHNRSSGQIQQPINGCLIMLSETVELAITECIREGILKEFLEKNRAEVKKVSIYEYDEEKHMRQEREAAWEDGRRQLLITKIKRKLAKGKTIPEIADELEETEERISALIEEMNKEQ